MTAKSQPHHDAEMKNQALWDEIAPVHLKAYKEVALLREGAEVLDEIELRSQKLPSQPACILARDHRKEGYRA